MAKDFKYTGYNEDLKNISRTLRKGMTPQEKKLWYQFLKKHPVRFNRQRPIDKFVVDFYSSKANLVIELDGSQHYEENKKREDEERTRIINSYGIDILRFSNHDIDTNFEGVCMKIDKIICEKMKNKSLFFDF